VAAFTSGGPPRNAAGGHGGLVVEDPAEVVAVGKDLVLPGQEGAAGVHEIDARQPVVQGDLLGAQMLLDRHRVIGAALDRGVIGDHHHLTARHPADPGDHPGGRRLPVVHPVGGQRCQFEKGGARVEQPVHPVPGQQLSPRGVARAGSLAAAEPRGGQLVAQVRGQRGMGPRIGLIRLRRRISGAGQGGCCHGSAPREC
jgi:hypothetical protein